LVPLLVYLQGHLFPLALPSSIPGKIRSKVGFQLKYVYWHLSCRGLNSCIAVSSALSCSRLNLTLMPGSATSAARHPTLSTVLSKSKNKKQITHSQPLTLHPFTKNYDFQLINQHSWVFSQVLWCAGYGSVFWKLGRSRANYCVFLLRILRAICSRFFNGHQFVLESSSSTQF
jgi:hypothetical protein